ncbi:hypothetical protein [Fischerella sp. JS2]|uniref:hypothetical protein n=1 Tax=Fischerella sp. JS2 TaxID=2597771 RepID=UPI0028E7FF50|nr:hypothetical protein [Fischerella sp. JS2]
MTTNSAIAIWEPETEKVGVLCNQESDRSPGRLIDELGLSSPVGCDRQPRLSNNFTGYIS